jgi:bifunctional non-homologous end joining protein LigD
VADPIVVAVDGRTLRLTNLDKVLYPATGTTKGEVVDYLTRASPAIVPWLAGRPVTRKRWPDGVASDPFFEKNLPRGTPDWVRRVTLHHTGARSGRGERDIDYPLVDSVATLVWFANAGALELHVPQWRIGDSGEPQPPDRLVVDLDPGPPAGLSECRTVALLAREMLAHHGLDPVPVTSGSKGMQLYAPLPPATSRGRGLIERAGSPAEYARALAAALGRALPDLVVTTMTRSARAGRVYVDWSQNNPSKTTICPWSLRGREHPTVATPLRWAEVEDGSLHQADLYEAIRLLADPERPGPP